MSTQPKQPEWTYSQYRAMLRRNGVNYAIVSPDHVNALSEEQAKELLDLLNGQSAAHQIAAHTSAAVAEAVKQAKPERDSLAALVVRLHDALFVCYNTGELTDAQATQIETALKAVPPDLAESVVLRKSEWERLQRLSEREFKSP